eukprot:Polyplicarium_translucidae@DN4735_c0_g1_i1.p1
MRDFEDNGDPNMRRSSKEFPAAIKYASKYGVDYAMTVKHVLVCPHVLDLRKGEHKTLVARINYIQVTPAMPLKVDSSGKVTTAKRLKSLPWRALNTEGEVPVDFHSKRSAVDAETGDFWLYWFRSAQEQAKLPRSRKLWAEKRKLGESEQYPTSRKLDFGCPGDTIFSHANPHNRETLNHCIVYPVKVNELFPEEVAIIQCGDIYPVGTKVVYARDQRSDDPGAIETEFRWFLRVCTKRGWTQPTHLDQRTGADAHRRCRASQAVAPSRWGFPAEEKEESTKFGDIAALFAKPN